MKNSEINSKIDEGYKLLVCLTPTKKYDKITLKTYLQKEGINIIHPVYYKHCEKLLNKDQLRLIELYNEVKNYRFAEEVELNIAYRKDPTNYIINEKVIVMRSIKKIEYLEQS